MKLSTKIMLLMVVAATSGSLFAGKKKQEPATEIARLENLQTSTRSSTKRSSGLMDLRSKIVKPSSDLDKTKKMLAAAAKKKADDAKNGIHSVTEFQLLVSPKNNLSTAEKLERILQKDGGLQFLNSAFYRRNEERGLNALLNGDTQSNLADQIEAFTNKIDNAVVAQLAGKQFGSDELAWLQATAYKNSTK